MASVHIARLVASSTFARTVAVKRMHPQFAKDPEFAKMFDDEARLVARIRHIHVVPTLDVVAQDGELFLVMEYVHGESLSKIMRASASRDERPSPSIVAAVVSGLLEGLHAAHEAKSDAGEPLGIVHRDISPHNVLVGVDGIARVLDFGIAKAFGRSHATVGGQVKGKAAYMAPEQIRGESLDRRADVFAAGIVLWELLTRARLFAADEPVASAMKILAGAVDPPSSVDPSVDAALDTVTLSALAPERDERFPTALDMARALERAVPLAPAREVGAWVERLVGLELSRRAERIAEIEKSSGAPSPQRLDLSNEGLVFDDRTTVPELGPPPRPDPPGATATSHAVIRSPSEHPRRRRARPFRWAGAALVSAMLAMLAIFAGGRRTDGAAPKLESSATATPESTVADAPPREPPESLPSIAGAKASSMVPSANSASAASPRPEHRAKPKRPDAAMALSPPPTPSAAMSTPSRTCGIVKHVGEDGVIHASWECE
jgi:eukaryotic-like serine/threonine-protein kinase